MTRPSVADVVPRRSERARSLRRNPSSAIAAFTRSAVSGATPGSSLITRLTVFKLTPALSATWRIVGRACLISSADNVVIGGGEGLSKAPGGEAVGSSTGGGGGL